MLSVKPVILRKSSVREIGGIARFMCSLYLPSFFFFFDENKCNPLKILSGKPGKVLAWNLKAFLTLAAKIS